MNVRELLSKYGYYIYSILVIAITIMMGYGFYTIDQHKDKESKEYKNGTTMIYAGLAIGGVSFILYTYEKRWWSIS